MRPKRAVLFSLMCALMSTTLIIAPVFSGASYYHEAGNVNYPGSFFESAYIDKDIGVDYCITIVDIALLMRAYLTNEMYPYPDWWGTDYKEWPPGSGQWYTVYNPDADIDGDGYIRVWDLDIMWSNWGLNYSYTPFVTETGIPKVRVRPPTKRVSVGEQFNVNITITNVVGLNTYEFTLSWNPTLVNAISAVAGSFLPSVYGDSIINNTAGWLYFGASTMEPPSQDGSGILATITFECLETDITILDLSSRLLSFTLNSMPHRDYNGRIIQRS